MKNMQKIGLVSISVLIFIIAAISVYANISDVTVNSPSEENFFTNDTTPSFDFTVDGDNATYDCDLIIDSNSYGNISAANNSPTTITANASLSEGTYEWYVSCEDSGANIKNSTTRNITVDTTAPVVDAVTFSQSTITEADLGTNFTVTINFTEEMNFGTSPSFNTIPANVIGPAGSGSLYACFNGSQAGWINGKTYEFNCTVVDGNQTYDSINLTFSQAQDMAFNTMSDYVDNESFTIDTQEPNMDFDAATTDAGNLSQNWIYVNLTNLSVTTDYDTYNISLYDSGDSLVGSVQLSSLPILNNFTSLAADTYRIEATTNDTSGNSYVLTRFITLDTTGPGITILEPSPAEGYLSMETWFYINFTTTEPVANASVNWDDSFIEGASNDGDDTKWWFNKTNLADGPHTYQIIATDYAGNQNQTIMYNFTMANQVMPNVTLSTPEDGFLTSATDGTFQFNFTVIDDSDPLNCSLNFNGEVNQTRGDVTNNTLLAWFTINNMPEGEHNWSVTCNDNYNFNTSEVRNFTVDNTDPETNKSEYLISHTNINFDNSGEEFYFEFNTTEEVNTTTDPTIVFTPDISSAFTSCGGTWQDTTTYRYNCTITNGGQSTPAVNITVNDLTDIAGNNLASSEEPFVSMLSIDQQQPTVSNVAVTPFYFNGSTYFRPDVITVTAEVSDDNNINGATCAVSFNAVTGPWLQINNTYNGTHCIFTNVTHNGTDNTGIGVYVEDVAGNFAEVGNGPYKEDLDAPNTTASGNGGAYTFGTWTQNYVNVSLSCDDGTGSGCAETYYCQDTDNTCVPTETYSTPIEIAGEGVYYIRYISEDNLNVTETLEEVKNVSIMIDQWPVYINSDTGIMFETDNFVCSIPGQYEANQNVSVIINATDNVGVDYVKLNISDAVDDADLVNLTFNDTTGLWEGEFTVPDTSEDNFETLNITILADDAAGRGLESWGASGPYFVLIAYNMTTPPMMNSCEQNGPASTVMCDETDFTDVNFITEIMTNGSEFCNDGQEMPWGETFQKVVTFNFSSLNFSSPDIGTKLANLGSALIPYITPPGMFGDSYVYVNSTAFAELNSNTTITLYGLPFTDMPIISGPQGISNIQVTENTPYSIEITCDDMCMDWDEEEEDYANESDCLLACNADGDREFNLTVPNVDVTFTVEGFSQYNLSDNETPVATINTPVEMNYSSNETLFNVTANGTGTQMSNITLILNGQSIYTWENSDISEECVNLTPDFEVATCTFAYNLSDGDYTLEAYVYDLGGDAPGNVDTDDVNFTIDTTQPSTTDDAPAGWQNADFVVNLSATDITSGVAFTTYRVDAGAWTNGTSVSITTTTNHTIEYYSTDYAGNVESTNTVYAALDKADPTTTDNATGAWSGAAFSVLLTPADTDSGVAYTTYRLNGGTWTNGTSVFVNNSANNTIEYYAVDNAGNQESTNTVYAPLDLDAPSTTDDAPAGWQNTDFNVSLTPSDPLSGVNYTSYTLDGGSLTNGTKVEITTNGNHTVTYYSVDNVGNVESTNTAYAALDKVAPTTTTTLPTSWQTAAYTVTLTANDTLSGVDYTSIMIDNDGNWTNSTTRTVSTSGNHSVQFFSVDNAGNNETINNETGLLIDLTKPTTTLTTNLTNGTSYVTGIWTESNVTVTLTPADTHSGVNITQYCLDTVNTCTPNTTYTVPFNVTTTGLNYLRYKTIDVAGNEENTSSARIMLQSETQEILATNTTVNSTKPQVIVPKNNTEANITVDDDVNATLDLNENLNTSTGKVTLTGAIKVSKNTSSGSIELDLPANLNMSSNASWNGQFELPYIKPNSAVTVTPDSGYTSTTSKIVSIGLGDQHIELDKAARIKIPGEAGKLAGFYKAGTFTKITTTCANNTQAAGDALPANGTCKIDAGNDLIIWTKHFTEFVSYTQTAESSDDSSSSSSSSGGSYNPPDKSNFQVEKSQLFIDVLKGKMLSFEIGQTDSAIQTISVMPSKSMSQARIEFTQYKEKPDVKAINGAYKYLSIDTDTILNDNMDEATIRFIVPKSWVSENNIDENSVVMNRYANNKWNKLTTNLVETKGTYYVYEATTNGFSYFAISATNTQTTQLQPEQETTDETEPETTDAEQTEPEQDTAEQTEQIAKDSGLSIWWIAIIIVVVAVLLIGYIVTGKQHKKKHK